MFTYSSFVYKNENTPFPFSVPTSKDYKVYLNGKEIPVYSCRISAYPMNRAWPGFQRPISQTELASFVNLVTNEEVEITVEPLTKTAFKKAMLKPYASGINVQVNNGKITFTLAKNGTFVLELDDYHGLLYVFNNAPVPCENQESVTHYFGAGVHFPGKITLKSNESIYLEKDAYVYGCVYAENAQNIRIYGNGIFDNSTEERITEHCYENYTNGNLKLYDCKDVFIKGVGFTNSSIWCINFFHCFDVFVDSINVFGQWRYNSDGIDFVNSQRVKVLNSFFHSFDDSITVKGVDRFGFENNCDMLFENCTLICDWGIAMEIGFETECQEIHDITFKNCNVLRGGNIVCDIQNGDGAKIHNVVFENITVEHEFFHTKPMNQFSNEQEYTLKDTTKISALLRVRNPRFREMYSFLSPGTGDLSKKGTKEYASACDITVKNVKIYASEEFASNFKKDCAIISIDNIFPTTEYKNIVVENVTLLGKKLEREDMNIEINGCKEDVLIVK